MNGMMDETEQLVRRVRAGETEAYAELIRKFELPVWQVVAAMLQDFHEARDALQQTFVDAYVHLDQFQLGRDFGFWIKEIARNRVRQELRRMSRESNRLAVYRAQLEERLADAPTAERYEQKYFDALRRCRAELPERTAQALAWRYEGGKSFDEVAALLETTRSAAEKLLSRARVALRDCLATRLQAGGSV
jgi:RNA polymerase sigma-70 factor (ECF subfamily)